MLDQIAKQLRGPADPAFEKGKAQFREAPCHTVEENRLGGCMPRGGKVPNMVIGEIGRRQPDIPFRVIVLW